MLVDQCERVVAESGALSIDDGAVQQAASAVEPSLLEPPAWHDAGMYEGPPEQVVAWLMAYNAVNFCYWPERGTTRWHTVVEGLPVGRDDEALGIMVAFAAALRRGVRLDDGPTLAGLGLEDLRGLLVRAPGARDLPLLEARLAGLRELGLAWRRMGGPMGMMARSRGSAVQLVHIFAEECARWEDSRIWRGQRLRFLKRAQLCTAMIYGRLREEVGDPHWMADIGELTAFADYRLPQVLQGLGILRLAEPLAVRIAAQRLVPAGSAEEVALRAACVVGAERLRLALLPRFPGLYALQVDHYLWRMAVRLQDTLPPFHRTRTLDY